jgi:diguanylate cyclase (GGDEF)-like protein/PAS domain S-box-containing protein
VKRVHFFKIILLILLFSPTVIYALDKVVLQLKWTHAFQFAGYYVAQDRGYYKDAGLDVTILEAGPGIDPIEKVLDGEADFGVGTSSLLLSRESGKSVKVLSVIFQHSPQVLITNPLTAKDGIKNIVDKKIMIEPHADELFAYLKKQNVSQKDLNLLTHSFDPQDLIDGKVDAMSAYITYETWFLDSAGMNYNVFTPRSLGIDFYGDNLFTSEKMIKEHPEIVEKFKEASIKGWRYAMRHINETAQMIHDIYSDKLPVEFYKYEAHRMKELMQPNLVDIGYMSVNRWRDIANTYIELGLLPKDFNYNELIYNQNYEAQLYQAYKFIAFVIVLLALVAIVALYVYRINIKLKRSDESFRSLFNSLEEAVYVQDENGVFLAVNGGASRMYKQEEEWFIGKTPKDICAPEKNDLDALVINHNKAMIGESKSFEFWGIRSTGEIFPKEVHLSKGSWFGKDVVFATAIDISERKEHEIQLKHIAHFDILTGLPNRLLLSDRISQAIAQSIRNKNVIALAYLDIDGFKKVNDTHGHDVGDKLLIEVSKHMKSVLREGDTISRIGGDEFVIVLPQIENRDFVTPVLKRLLEAASQKINIDAHIINVSASIGVTFYPQEDDIDSDQLLRQADQAMYHAKQSGKNRYHFFDSENDKSIRIKHKSIENIQKALANNEFILYYQPKVNMRSGEVIGVEALIRWQHSDRSILTPSAFLPYIENHPLVIELGDWVIEKALEQIEDWNNKGIKLSVSVNIHALQLEEINFVEKVSQLLKRYPSIKKGQLEFEILETSALKDINHIASIIQKCNAMGIMFSLDDFGTGYSSLTYLKRLQAKTLKIDCTFVIDMLENSDDLAIVEGIVELSNTFKKDVIAEGVESVEHGTVLLSLGCELAQGYGIGKPMNTNDLEKWINDWNVPQEWLNYL